MAVILNYKLLINKLFGFPCLVHVYSTSLTCCQFQIFTHSHVILQVKLAFLYHYFEKQIVNNYRNLCSKAARRILLLVNV